MGLGFIARILIIRSITQAQYGVYSLGIAIISAFAVFSFLGLQRGIPRQLSYHRNKENGLKGRDIINSSFILALASSLACSGFIFFTSDIIFVKLFHEPALADPLRVFSITLPFIIVLRFFVSVFRGYERSDIKVYFNNIVRNIFFLLGVGIVFVLELSLIHLTISYFASFALTSVLLIIYIKKRAIIDLELDFDFSVGKEMILFSLPLLSSAGMLLIMSQMDTFVLGFFLSSEKVGLYRGAYPLAKMITLVLASSTFIYLPVLSKLYAKDKKKEIERIYRILSRWIYSLTFPIFLILFLFPKTVLGFLFGVEYEAASLALRVISAGFLIRVVVGMNGMSLTGMGKPKLNMYGNFIGGISNLILNFALIPFLGILGAAAATSFSYTAQNVYQLFKLNSLFGVHPFGKTYLKTISISVILLGLIFFFSQLVRSNIYFIIIFLLMYLLGFFAISYALGNYEKEDIDLLEKLYKKLKSYLSRSIKP
ncbi:hypothetical protein AKJ57_00395 [candidate division MSBL1 archaeon SCGC-AAA259A05]|uniref:Uncharacterized protein n=1 Tax=candidate division MSBL1 archaeon SCGC-AAA259A05 TaxID=1698259 RepID=A0A133UBU0_9EURY|nr:hypothetical protein AKJ57_00395 [candidate division MSBL1 archaeon SCGC-AAA259A05]